MKRTVSILLCLMLVLSMAIPAFAAGETYTLTINNATAGHTYQAYQIFTGNLVPSASDPSKMVLTDIAWGSAVAANASALLAEIVSTANAADASSPLKTLVSATDAASLAELIAKNITSDSESLDKLAAIFEKHIDDTKTTGTCTYHTTNCSFDRFLRT